MNDSVKNKTLIINSALLQSMKEFGELLIQNPDFKLGDSDPDNTFGRKCEDVEIELTDLKPILFELQIKLFVDNKNSVFIALQGMDTPGKDAIK